MIEEELQAIISRYQEKPETEYESVWQIFSFLYFKPFFFTTKNINPDTKNDFLVYLYPKISRFLQVYRKEKGSAQMFLRYFVRGYFKNFINKCVTSSRKLVLIHDDISVQELQGSINQTVFTSTVEADAVADITTEEPFSCKKIAHINKTDTKKFRKALLILALKSCMSIDDTTISLVARYTNISYQEIQTQIEKARSSIQPRCVRTYKKQLIRNEIYVKKRLIQAITPSTPAIQANIMHLEERIRHISKSIQNKPLTPTNRYIAKAIGVSFTTVNRYMDFLTSKESTGFFDTLRDTITP